MKPRLLDLFSGAGGSALGYHRAGFEVVGVDIKPQPRYPFEFHCADALDFCREYGKEFDVIHASPPCQAYSCIRHPSKIHHDYPDLIPATRETLILSGLPYVIENVPGAPLIKPIQICGSAFTLRVRRHRRFESNVDLIGSPCRHSLQGSPIDVSGTGARRITRRKDDHGGSCNKSRNLSEARAAIGIDWMTRYEISQAIPPAYTEWLGRQLMQFILRQVVKPVQRGTR